MKQSQNRYIHTFVSFILTLLSIVSGALVLSAGACSGGSHTSNADPTSPSFFMSQGKIYASSANAASLAVFRADTGKFLWQAPGSSYSPVVDNATAFIPLNIDETLIARDANSGEERWHLSGALRPDAVIDGIVYIHTAVGVNGYVNPDQFPLPFSAFQESDGRKLWTAQLKGQKVLYVEAEQRYLYVLTDGGFFALQVADGSLLWSSRDIGYNASFLSANGIIYLNRGNGALDALDANTGRLLWTFHAKNISSHPPILTSDGILSVETEVDVFAEPGELYGLRAKDGVQLWKRSGNFLSGTMITVEGVLYLSSGDKGLSAVRAKDGTELWRFNPGGVSNVDASSLVDFDENSKVIYTTQGLSVVALRTDGSLLQEIPLRTSLLNYQVSNGVVYQLIPGGLVGDSNEQHYTQVDLTATRGSDGKLLWSTHFQF